MNLPPGVSSSSTRWARREGSIEFCARAAYGFSDSTRDHRLDFIRCNVPARLGDVSRLCASLRLRRRFLSADRSIVNYLAVATYGRFCTEPLVPSLSTFELRPRLSPPLQGNVSAAMLDFRYRALYRKARGIGQIDKLLAVSAALRVQPIAAAIRAIWRSRRARLILPTAS